MMIPHLWLIASDERSEKLIAESALDKLASLSENNVFMNPTQLIVSCIEVDENAVFALWKLNFELVMRMIIEGWLFDSKVCHGCSIFFFVSSLDRPCNVRVRVGTGGEAQITIDCRVL